MLVLNKIVNIYVTINMKHNTTPLLESKIQFYWKHNITDVLYNSVRFY